VELGIDIQQKLGNISDYGNIQNGKVRPQDAINKQNIDELYDKLQKKHTLCL